jgi:hypothetical protein
MENLSSRRRPSAPISGYPPHATSLPVRAAIRDRLCRRSAEPDVATHAAQHVETPGSAARRHRHMGRAQRIPADRMTHPGGPRQRPPPHRCSVRPTAGSRRGALVSSSPRPPPSRSKRSVRSVGSRALLPHPYPARDRCLGRRLRVLPADPTVHRARRRRCAASAVATDPQVAHRATPAARHFARQRAAATVWDGDPPPAPSQCRAPAVPVAQRPSPAGLPGFHGTPWLLVGMALPPLMMACCGFCPPITAASTGFSATAFSR